MQLHRNSMRLTLDGRGEAGSAKQGSDDKMSEERGEDHISSKSMKRLRNAEIARKRRSLALTSPHQDNDLIICLNSIPISVVAPLPQIPYITHQYSLTPKTQTDTQVLLLQLRARPKPHCLKKHHIKPTRQQQAARLKEKDTQALPDTDILSIRRRILLDCYTQRSQTPAT
jgi:hypothetical protein